MKKFVAVISILLLLFCHFSAISEEIDLESMSTNELMQLQIMVQDELYKRDRFMDCFLNPGEYIVGEDIEPGDYLVHCVSVYNGSVNCLIALIDIETNKEIEHDSRFRVDNLHRFKMEIGTKFCISGGVVELLP